jgi:ABC-type amino acid transport system permease subunit
MTTVAILSVFAGMLIGMRFKLLAIMPVIITAMLAAAIVSAVQGDPVLSVLAAAALGAISAQVGYLCGSFVPFVKEVPEAAPARATPARLHLGIRTRSAD